MDIYNLFDFTKTIAESDETKEKSRTNPKYFTRKRNMVFSELVYYILSPGKESLQLGLNRFFRMTGKEEFTMSEQAFSKARGHFNHLPFETMVRKTSEFQYSEEKISKYEGKLLFAVDGTTLALPDKPNLCKSFGASGRKKDSATAKVSMLYDIENDWIADAAISTYKTTEHKLAMGHIDRICELGIAEESLLLFDRGYPQKELITKMDAKKISFLMRCRRKWNTTIDETDKEDFIIAFANDIKLRVIKLTLSTGEIETLITNCLDLPYNKFLSLYFKRWGVEIKYDVLKNKLELGNFTGYSPNAILQDFWACIHLANIVATIKQDADNTIRKIREDSQNKHSYQVNTAQLVGSLKDYFIIAVFIKSKKKREKAIDRLRLEVSQALSPIRENRSFRRNPWPRKTKYHFNSKSNI